MQILPGFGDKKGARGERGRRFGCADRSGLPLLFRSIYLLLAASALHTQSAPAPAVRQGTGSRNALLHVAAWEPPARYAKIDQLLHEGDWPAAEIEGRAAIADDLKERVSYLGRLLRLLAVAEAGQNHSDNALWHWQVGLAIGQTRRTRTEKRWKRQVRIRPAPRTQLEQFAEFARRVISVPKAEVQEQERL